MVGTSRVGRLAGVVFMIAAVCFAAACASTSTKSAASVRSSPKLVDLATLVPSDLDAAVDCAAYRNPTPRGLVGLVKQLNCVEGESSQIAGASVDAYQFDSAGSLHTSFDAINAGYHFFPGSAGAQCPPKRESEEGLIKWHPQGTKATSGTLECYSTTDGGHIYIWTNEPDRTLYFARVEKAISFAKLHLWWTRTGCCR